MISSLMSDKVINTGESTQVQPVWYSCTYRDSFDQTPQIPFFSGSGACETIVEGDELNFKKKAVQFMCAAIIVISHFG